ATVWRFNISGFGGILPSFLRIRTRLMIDWNAIDTVLLDMDGTLLDLHFDNYFWLQHLPKRYAEIHQLDLETATDNLYRHIRAHEGTLQWYCLDFWSEALKL